MPLAGSHGMRLEDTESWGERGPGDNLNVTGRSGRADASGRPGRRGCLWLASDGFLMALGDGVLVPGEGLFHSC